jgi:hypothetical protein
MPLIFEPKLTILSCIAFKSLKFNSTKKSRTQMISAIGDNSSTTNLKLDLLVFDENGVGESKAVWAII